MKKYFTKLLGVMLSLGFLLTISNVDFAAIFSLEDNCVMTTGNFETLSNEKTFGSFVSSTMSENTWTVGGVEKKETSLVVKLFGFIPIKKVNLVVCNDKSVYLGGIPLGFSITTKGVIVIGQNSVLTEHGNVSPTYTKRLKVGDVLTKVNDVNIEDFEEIQKILNKSNGQKVKVLAIRDGKEIESEIVPIKDGQSGDYKLGLWVRNDAQGIGTLTFVTEDDKFGALGHAITDYETGIEVPIDSGKVYDCTTIGITKGSKGKAGELRCLFVQGEKNEKGDIYKNTKYGVFGELDKVDDVVDKNLCADVGSRMIVQIGDAKIVSSVSGIRQEYDIEIIKTYHQNSSKDKSLIFRVKDKELLNLTGGIVQGMSGSPIVQNGKIIGAVTHVFLNDPTKGYGVYVDWMLREVE